MKKKGATKRSFFRTAKGKEMDEVEVGDSGSNSKRSKKESGLSETLLDLDAFDCSVCMEVLSPPVFQCQSGHLACSGCCNAVGNECPSCKMPIGYIRCLGLEKVMESMKVYCEYKDYGCTETFTCTKKLEHEEKCTFAPFTCPVSDCNICFPSTELPLHLSKDNPSSVKLIRYNHRFTVSIDKSEQCLIFQGGEKGDVFILSHRARSVGSATSLACLGSKSKNGGFEYEVMVRKEKRSLRLQSQTECVRKQCEAYSVGDVLVIPVNFYSSGKVKLEMLVKNMRRSDA